MMLCVLDTQSTQIRCSKSVRFPAVTVYKDKHDANLWPNEDYGRPKLSWYQTVYWFSEFNSKMEATDIL